MITLAGCGQGAETGVPAATPSDVSIETPDDGVVEVHARVLVGRERDAAWTRFTAASPGFRQYEQRTSRVIPVVELRRR